MGSRGEAPGGGAGGGAPAMRVSALPVKPGEHGLKRLRMRTTGLGAAPFRSIVTHPHLHWKCRVPIDGQRIAHGRGNGERVPLTASRQPPLTSGGKGRQMAVQSQGGGGKRPCRTVPT